jgi:hypothetical protein
VSDDTPLHEKIRALRLKGLGVAGWTACCDRYPDNVWQKYLTARSDGYVRVGMWTGGVFQCPYTGDVLGGEDRLLTHWMPLPEPPPR